jgi:hypothetical protein
MREKEVDRIVVVDHMRIDKILFVSDANTNYLSFWNAISKHHVERFGIPCKLFFIGTKTQDNEHMLSEEYGDVEIVRPIPDIPIVIQALWGKFWFTQTELDTRWLIGDIDMFILNKKYLFETTAQIPDDGYGHIYAFEQYYPGFFHCAKGRIFKEYLELTDSFENECRMIYESRRYGLFENAPERVKDKPHYEYMICEEMLSTERLRTKPVTKILKPNCPDEDIMFSEHLIMPNGCVRDPSVINMVELFDHSKRTSYYWFHCPRPYSAWKDQIETILSFYTFDDYIQKVGDVRSADDLCRLICSIGLYYDPRNIYGQWMHCMNAPGAGGLWQNPMELARFLWDTKDRFKQAGVQSYLDIGTFNGCTFFVILYFLRAHVCSTIRAKTIDPCRLVHPSVYPYIREYCFQGTIDDISEQWDLVFIDGDHVDPGPIYDFQSVRGYSKFVVFHDIVDKFCPDVRTTFETVSKDYPSETWIEHDDQFGIGILFLE